MSTTPEEAQGTPAPDHDFEELTGVYGFFRRHQKKLLYTAGLFTLLTFSITGSMTSLVEGLSRSQKDLATMQVNGEEVMLTPEDYQHGNQLARRWQRGVPYGVMLQVLAGESGENELGEVFAMMRRAAITEGIGASMSEVDRAIEAAREAAQAESAAKLAVSLGYSSLAEYRMLVSEAMRIGVFMRLQTLAFNCGDAEVMRQVLLHQEKITFKVATYDEKARQDEMKETSELTDDDLKKWLEDQNDMQKGRMNAFDLPTVQLRFAALLWSEGNFKPEEFADGVLEGYTVTDDQLKTYYDAEKEFFKIEAPKKDPKEDPKDEDPEEQDPEEQDPEENGADEYRPFEDEAVKAELTRMVQAERVMMDLNTKIKAAQLAFVQPKTDAVAEAQNANNEAQGSFQKAAKEKYGIERRLKAKETELSKDAENAELKTAVETLKTELAAATDAHTAAEGNATQMKTALEAAQKAEDDARTNFDFAAEFDKLVEGKSGFVHKALDKQVSAEDLKDLDALGLDLGHWERSMVATSMRSVGSIGNGPGRTHKAAIIYQSQAMEARPLKPWDDLKTLVQDAYWTEKAVAEGREKTKAMTEALLKLGKEKIADFIAEGEKERQGRIDKMVADWEAEVNADIVKAGEMLNTPNFSSKLVKAWQTKLDRKQRELDGKKDRINMFGLTVGREIDNEVAEEAKKHYGDVLDAAAAECGYKVVEVGPHPRVLNQRPRFADAFDKTIVYVFQNHQDMDEGESAGPVTDMAERRSHVIACTKVVPMTAADITRRDFERRRKFFLQWQVRNGQQQAFTKAALEARYQVKRPSTEVIDQE